MSDDEHVKILVIGPSKAGKTTTVNFLCGVRDTPSSQYDETNPLRIVETHLDLEAMKLGDRRVVFSGGDAKKKRVVVRLWDLGGSSRHQAGWPAVAHKADVNQDELDDQGNFALRVKDEHSLVFAHHSSPPRGAGGPGSLPPMPKGLEKVRVVETSLDYQSENFKELFDKLVERIIVSRMDMEEEALLRQERDAADRPQLRV